MHFSSLTKMFMFSITLLSHNVFAADPLFHFCSDSEKYTTGSPFNNNLKMLFSYLSSKASPTGFGTKSIGQDHDVVNGLALCRGDVQSADCKTCITEASSEIVQRCSNDKGGIIWYDNCLLKYSNINFFGNIDYQYRFYMYNLKNISESFESFNRKTSEFLSELTSKAYKEPFLFGTGEEKLSKTDKLYGLVQCTRDLSGVQCKKCLEDAISEIGSCCDGKIGGRVVGGSCNFRYELYPFVKP